MADISVVQRDNIAVLWALQLKSGTSVPERMYLLLSAEEEGKATL